MPSTTGSDSLLSDFMSFHDLWEYDHNIDKGDALSAERNFVELNVDYSKFSNHAFFNSAYTKAYNAIYRAQNHFEHDFTYKQFNEMYYSGTHYDRYIYDTHPKQVGYLSLDGASYVSGTDGEGFLAPGSGSWSIEGWLRPCAPNNSQVVFNMSGTAEMILMYYDDATQQLTFGIVSASTTRTGGKCSTATGYGLPGPLSCS